MSTWYYHLLNENVTPDSLKQLVSALIINEKEDFSVADLIEKYHAPSDIVDLIENALVHKALLLLKFLDSKQNRIRRINNTIPFNSVDRIRNDINTILKRIGRPPWTELIPKLFKIAQFKPGSNGALHAAQEFENAARGSN